MNQIASIEVCRCSENPLITANSSPTLGDNINGPSVIRVPDWLPIPLGRYFMYFAHHGGKFIRLAYADDPVGPWKIYEPGTLQLEQVPAFTGHVASPDVHVDRDQHRIRMYVHGPDQEIRSQWTTVATSKDGLHFRASNEILGRFYFRVWQWDGDYYAWAKNGNNAWGLLYRSPDGLTGFEERDHFLYRARHTAVLVRGHHLLIFYSRIGDEPERILVSTVDLRPDWHDWQASAPIEVLKPETDYEGIQYLLKPSKSGFAIRVQELRDPCILEDNGRTYLYYSVAGEMGIAMAELEIQMKHVD